MGRQILLENIAVPGIRTFDVYRKTGGYDALFKVLREMSPDDVISEVKKVRS